MRYLFAVAVVIALLLGLVTGAFAASQYHVAKISIGDDVSQVFKSLGTPSAVQIIDNKDAASSIQLLYFHGKESLAIDVTDLPDNRVTQIEVCGASWPTDLPAKCGMDIDTLVTSLGTPDATKDVSAQKKWVLDQVGKNGDLKSLVEYSVGDTAAYYYKLGLLLEYDKSARIIKSVRILDPAKAPGMSLTVS